MAYIWERDQRPRSQEIEKVRKEIITRVRKDLRRRTRKRKKKVLAAFLPAWLRLGMWGYIHECDTCMLRTGSVEGESEQRRRKRPRGDDIDENFTEKFLGA